MRKSLKKIFKRNDDGTEHEYEEEESDTSSPTTPRYSVEQRRSLGDVPGSRRSVDLMPAAAAARRETKKVQAILSGSNPLPGAAPAPDDELVNSVLYRTRGQQGPVVAIGGDGNPTSDPGTAGSAYDGRPTIRAVNDERPGNQGESSSVPGVRRKPVPTQIPERQPPNGGPNPFDDGRNYVPPSTQKTTTFPLDSRDTLRRQSIDKQGTNASSIPPSPTSVAYGPRDRRSFPRSGDTPGTTAVISGNSLTNPPPRRSSLQNSIDASGTDIALAAGLPRSSPQSKRSSFQAIDDNRKTINSSVDDTGFNAPHGLLDQTNRNSSEPSNVATLPNTATSTKLAREPRLGTSPDVAASSGAARSAIAVGPGRGVGVKPIMVGSDTRRASADDGQTSPRSRNRESLQKSEYGADVTTAEKPNGTSGGWPLKEHATDPLTTKYKTGQQINVATGPIAAAFAEKYSEPDKFSRHVHVHKEPTKIAPAVVHERIQKKVHEIVTEQIERHIHTHEVRVHIQPIFHQERLPDRHWVQQADGSLTEISAQMADILKLEPGYREVERFEEKIDHRGNSNLDPSKLAGARHIGS